MNIGNMVVFEMNVDSSGSRERVSKDLQAKLNWQLWKRVNVGSHSAAIVVAGTVGICMVEESAGDMVGVEG